MDPSEEVHKNPRFDCQGCGRVYFVGDAVFMGLDKCFCGKWCRYAFLREVEIAEQAQRRIKKRATGSKPHRSTEYDSFCPAQTDHTAH